MDIDETLTNYQTIFLNPKENIPLTLPHVYSLDKKIQTPIAFGGPIDNIGDVKTYGIVLSSKLMKDLKLFDGDIVYFKLNKV